MEGEQMQDSSLVEREISKARIPLIAQTRPKWISNRDVGPSNLQFVHEGTPMIWVIFLMGLRVRLSDDRNPQ